MSMAREKAPAPGTRVLLTGASGQLGRETRAVAEAAGLGLHAYDRSALDIADMDAVRAVVTAVRPDWIVNAAAYTAVDRAETDAGNAYAINRDGTGHLAQAAQQIGARMVQVSTDYVFDGTLGRPYRPDDTPQPLGVYGKSKLAGERAAQDALDQDKLLVLRTSWVYAHHGRNFVRTMLRLLAERNEIRVVDDQIGTPTRATSLARVIVAMIGQGASGTHHWTDAGTASWFDFAVAIQREGLRTGMIGSTCRIVPIPSHEYPTPAPRPSCSLLDKESLRRLLGSPGRHWQNELRDTMDLLAGIAPTGRPPSDGFPGR